MEGHSTNEDYLNLIPCRESLFYALVFYVLIIHNLLHAFVIPLGPGPDAGELNEEILSIIGFSYAIKQVFKRN